MIKRLLIVALFIIATGLTVTFVVSQHHTAVFKACLGTEYCSDLGRAQQRDPVRIQYAGWPFKVKIGNPDWCGYGVCEGNNFHPGYQREFLVYDAAILSLPSIVLLIAYWYRREQRVVRRLMVKLVVLAVSVVLGWVTVSGVTSKFVWHNASQEQSSAEAYAGIPFHETFSGLSWDCIDTSCVKKVLKDDPLKIWHSDTIVYLNWIFWLLLWVTLIWLIGKKYAHHRH